VVIRRQDVAEDGSIVAALMPGPAEEEATVKRLKRTGSRIILVPENPAMDPFDLPEGGRILGQVVAVLRKL
jgi:repressor LexA